jgi:ribosomal protein S18 acetylase RimI-like enzyme
MAGDDLDERIAAIEDAFVAHWSHFGRWSHGSLHDEDGVTWFETPIRNLPYNMVIRTRIAGSEAAAAAVIGRLAGRFRSRDVPYIWAQLPNDRPEDLGHHLARQGLDMVETITGMDLDLTAWSAAPAPADVRIVRVDHDEAGMADYVALLRTYWSVPESEQHLLETFNREWSGDRAPGMRLVAYVDDRPVGKLFMNVVQLPAAVSIYGVAVRPEARGRGVATALMEEALRRAVAAGAERCVLHSSQMAVSLYSRMGFTQRCMLLAWATGPLFGTHQH